MIYGSYFNDANIFSKKNCQEFSPKEIFTGSMFGFHHVNVALNLRQYIQKCTK